MVQHNHISLIYFFYVESISFNPGNEVKFPITIKVEALVPYIQKCYRMNKRIYTQLLYTQNKQTMLVTPTYKDTV